MPRNLIPEVKPWTVEQAAALARALYDDVLSKFGYTVALGGSILRDLKADRLCLYFIPAPDEWTKKKPQELLEWLRELWKPSTDEPEEPAMPQMPQWNPFAAQEVALDIEAPAPPAIPPMNPAVAARRAKRIARLEQQAEQAKRAGLIYTDVVLYRGQDKIRVVVLND